MKQSGKISLIAIFIFLAVTIPMVVFVLQDSISKPSFEASLSANPSVIKSLKADEQIIRGQSYDEGKLTIVSLTYQNLSSDELTDIKIILKTNGTEIAVAAPQYAKSDGFTPHGDPIYYAYRSLQPMQKKIANFYIYSKKPGSAILTAEIVSNENKKALTKPVTLNIINP